MRLCVIPFLAALTLTFTAPAEELTLSVAAPTVTEGAPLAFTVQRTGTVGALNVNYEVGAPIAEVIEVIASSGSQHAATVCDGRLDTQWTSSGFSEQPHEKDASPSLTLVLAKPTPIAALRLANYVSPGHTFRGVNEVRLEVSDDGTVFKVAGVFEFRPCADALTVSVFQRVPLDVVVTAKVVRLVAVTNHANTKFGPDLKIEGQFSNGSYCGVAEIQLESIGIAGNDVAASNGTLTIPEGADRASFPVVTTGDSSLERNEALEVRILLGTGYEAGIRGRAQAMILDDDGGDEISISAPSATTSEKGGKKSSFRITRTRTAGALTVRYSTSNVPVKIATISASDAHYNCPTAFACDGNPETYWMNNGNGKLESEMIDEPWIAFTFAEPYVLGAVRIANYANPGHSMRCVRELEMLGAVKNADFTPLGTFTLARTDDQAKAGSYQTFPLPGVLARRVLLRVKSNYFTEFGKGTSFEGTSASGSIVGLSEVQFMTGSTAGSNDFIEVLNGTVVIPDGKAFVDLPVTAKDDKIKEGTEQVLVVLIPDDAAYLLSPTASSAAVSIIDND